jgi:TonB family protein
MTFAAAVVACAIWLGVLLVKPVALQIAMMRTYPKSVSAAPAVAAPAVEQSNPAPSPDASHQDETVDLPQQQPVSKPVADPQVPSGSLQVFENGKEVFRMPPAPTQVSPKAVGPSAGPEKAAALPSLQTNGILLHRVEPEYPAEAREQRVQGLVVLEVHVGTDGVVQDVQALSGPPLLVKASTDAVKQWRFKPHLSNGHAVEMQSTVSLNFRLPD